MRVAALCLWLALTGCKEQPAARPTERSAKPELALLTSLPIVFSEQFTLDAPKNPLLETLERSFTVTPVDGPEQLKPGGLMLAVQPQALTAERLVELDKWVRDGGRLILLADPQLAWESERPLGDRFRPPYAYPDTGLLAHWGLRLKAPVKPGPSTRRIGLAKIATVSSGTIESFGRDCIVIPDNFAAVCRLGKGSAAIFADADFAMSADEDDRAAVVQLVSELQR